MKRIYATILLSSLSLVLKAQCTPDETIKATGLFYNKEIPFCVNQYYDEVFQLAVTNDTTIIYGNIVIPANVDSSEIISVSGLPEGLSYSCPTENCKTINSGGKYSHNCLNVTGTPTVAKDYTVKFKFRLYGKDQVIGQAAQIDQDVTVSLTVSTCTATGITTDLSSKKNISIYPQPAKSTANMELLLNSNSNVSVTIHNLLGYEIKKAYNGSLGAGTNNINISESINSLSSGLYMITTEISSSGKTESYTKRLVIE